MGSGSASAPGLPSHLEEFFNARREGPGIWKWRHYFDIYDRHFSRFRGKEVHIVEVGIYSGGSLDMWQDYFGPQCHVYGMDIEPACKAYEREGVKVFIGDQSDRNFWRTFRQEVPRVDILIDDGSHIAEHQIITLEETLPHISPGGVYVCEDVHRSRNMFATYVHGLMESLNGFDDYVESETDPERRTVCPANEFQRAIASIHQYPFVTVIEKRGRPLDEFVGPKHGTEWQPFLKWELKTKAAEAKK